MTDFFRKFAQGASIIFGSAWAFNIAGIMVFFWLFSGPYFHYSDTWELVINTVTTVITFLMVFLIQNSQNREMKSLNLKIDELIRTTKLARNGLIELENMSEEEVRRIEQEFNELIQKKKEDFTSPEKSNRH